MKKVTSIIMGVVIFSLFGIFGISAFHLIYWVGTGNFGDIDGFEARLIIALGIFGALFGAWVGD